MKVSNFMSAKAEVLPDGTGVIVITAKEFLQLSYLGSSVQDIGEPITGSVFNLVVPKGVNGVAAFYVPSFKHTQVGFLLKVTGPQVDAAVDGGALSKPHISLEEFWSPTDFERVPQFRGALLECMVDGVKYTTGEFQSSGVHVANPHWLLQYVDGKISKEEFLKKVNAPQRVGQTLGGQSVESVVEETLDVVLGILQKNKHRDELFQLVKDRHERELSELREQLAVNQAVLTGLLDIVAQERFWRIRSSIVRLLNRFAYKLSKVLDEPVNVEN